MMDFWTVVRERRSIRRYASRPVPREWILRVLDAARWAPSAHNRQPWRFAVIPHGPKREALLRAMAERWREDLRADGLSPEAIEARVARSQSRLREAPVLILVALSMRDMDVYEDERRRTAEYVMAVQSTAMAGQNALLAAHALGLGACWVCAPLYTPDVARAVLGLPEDWIAQGFITLGFPAETRQGERRPLTDVVRWLEDEP